MFVCIPVYVCNVCMYVCVCVYVSSGGTGDTRPEVELLPQDLHWLPALHIVLRWLPTLHMVWLPTTRFFITRAPNLVTRLDVQLHPYTGSLHWLPVLHIAIRWLHIPTPYIRFYLKGSHKDIFKNESPIRIPNFICFQEIIST